MGDIHVHTAPHAFEEHGYEVIMIANTRTHTRNHAPLHAHGRKRWNGGQEEVTGGEEGVFGIVKLFRVK